MPAWPQPVTTLTPRDVRTSSAWSSGSVSSTSPAGPAIFSEPLQLRSGKARGTGPVSQTPG